MTLRLAKPFSTTTTDTGTRIEKVLTKGKNILLTNETYLGTGGENTLGKLITFAPNSTSKFAKAGADQVFLTHTPNKPYCKKLLSFFDKGMWLGDIWICNNEVVDTNLTKDFLKKSGLSKKFNI